MRKVRVGTGQTFGEVYARLTRVQQGDLAEVVRANDWARLRQIKADAAQADLYRIIYDAMTHGVPVKMIAETLDLSSSRVYQIRDQVYAARSAA